MHESNSNGIAFCYSEKRLIWLSRDLGAPQCIGKVFRPDLWPPCERRKPDARRSEDINSIARMSNCPLKRSSRLSSFLPYPVGSVIAVFKKRFRANLLVRICGVSHVTIWCGEMRSCSALSDLNTLITRSATCCHLCGDFYQSLQPQHLTVERALRV